MATEFSREFFEENRIVKADLRAAHQLREEDIARIKNEVKKLYDATEVILNVAVDESLLSGYVLQVGDRMFDNSGRHQLDQMMAGKPSLATLKTRVEDYKPAQTSEEGGVVVASADGIVQVEGMDRAVYGEIVTFENGAKGMVESVEPGRLGIMLFDGAESVGVGTLVTRSGKRAGIPVGEKFLGRVIDPLGEPIDGKGPIEAEGYNPIEKQAPGILERQSVDTPLHTGILAIDSMFPIGRGQRELIIGDRQTGKTSIATDAILNQNDTGVLCIYVAIGQKASSIARVAEDLKKHGAMSYTTIVAATASDSAPLQYIAPYAGTALAEYFMDKGKSVLIVYDDLSKHAIAYRALSLLLDRFDAGEINSVWIIYTDMKNGLEATVHQAQVMPLHRERFHAATAATAGDAVYEFVPSAKAVLDNAARSCLTGYIYSALVDSFCSEQSARMTAMNAADQNAEELLKDLSVQFNRARQAAMTQEITEVSAGERAQRSKKEKEG